MKLIFATSNQHKLREIKAVALPGLEIVSLKDIGFTGELPETHETIEENSLEKAEYLSNLYNTPCFAEDTGLFVEALHGAPGVRSARYAGESNNPIANIAKLLHELQGQTNRKAYFKTVICLIDTSGTHYFEGICPGHIADSADGLEGFGYDPVFIPEGHTLRFASMLPDEKSRISHRKKAFDLFADFLARR